MHADINGALANINKSWRVFQHKGNPMTKAQVTAVLLYAQRMGYDTTAELTDEEIDQVLNS